LAAGRRPAVLKVHGHEVANIGVQASRTGYRVAIGVMLVVLLSALSSYRSHVARSHRTGAASAPDRAARFVEACCT
jgi:hypothetical protein